MEKYFVPKIDTPLEGVVTVPGSKSMTNRTLLLATLSKEESVLRGVLFSDDSRHFLACLQSLGFLLEINENEKVVKIKGTGGRIPYKTGTIDVGSAGTAARFLTAMLALSDGEYTVMCSEQMEKDLWQSYSMFSQKWVRGLNILRTRVTFPQRLLAMAESARI